MPFLDRDDPMRVQTRSMLGVDIAEDEVPRGKLLDAAFRQDNEIVSVVNALSNAKQFEPEPGYDPLEPIRGTKYEAYHKPLFAQAVSRAQTEHFMRKVDQEERDIKIVQSNGAAGFAASVLAGLLSPTTLLPGGQFYRAGKIGYKVGRTATSVAAAGGAQVAIQEGLLQATQETRDATTSFTSIGAGTILAGLIGGGAAAMLTRGERQALERAIDNLAKQNESILAKPLSSPQAAGAAVTDTRTMELTPILRGILTKPYDAIKSGAASVPVIGGFLEGVVTLPERAITASSPALRIFNLKSLAARRLGGDLAESPVEFTDAQRGVTQTKFAAPADRTIKDEVIRLRVGLEKSIDAAYNDYRFNGKPGVFEGVAAKLTKSEYLTKAEFEDEISRALMNGEVHPIKQVENVAKLLRKDLFDTWNERAKMAIPNYKEFSPDDGKPYFPHYFDKQAIKANYDEFVRLVFDDLKQDQAVKFAAQTKLRQLHEKLRESDKIIDRLSKRLETKERQLDLTNAALRERRIEARAAMGRTNTLADRRVLINEAVDEINRFIDDAGIDLQKPEFTDDLQALQDIEKELRAAERAENFTEQDLLARDREEARSVMTGTVRRAAEIYLGKRKPPKTYSLIGYISRNGGIDDVGGDVASVVGGRKEYFGLIRKVDRATQGGQSTFGGMAATGGKKVLDLDGWGEKLAQDFPEAFPGGRPDPNEVLDLIDRASRGEVFDWMQPWSDADVEAMSMAAMLDNLIRDSGSNFSKVDDFVEIFRYTDEQTADDFDARLANMEAAGATVPVRFEREGVTLNIEVKQEQIAAIRQRIADARAEKQGLRAQERLTGIRATEAGVASRRSISRLEVLDKRIQAIETMQQLLQRARANTEIENVSARKEIEDIVNSWQGNSASEAQSALKRRAEQERVRDLEIEAGIYQGRGERLRGADAAIDDAVEIILRSNRELTDEELLNIAKQFPDRINGTPDGRLPYDGDDGASVMGVNGANVMRGSLARRKWNISTEKIFDKYLIKNVREVANSYLRTFIPDVILSERFGDPTLQAAMREVQIDYENLRMNAKSPQESLDLDAEYNNAVRDLSAWRDRIRNMYGYSADTTLRNLGRFAEGAKNANVGFFMGGMTMSQVPVDFAVPVFVNGFQTTFRRAWLPYFKYLTTGLSDLKVKQEIGQARAMGIAFETYTNLNNSRFADTTQVFQPETALERGLATSSNVMMVANLSSVFTDIAKLMASSATMHSILYHCERVGKILPRLTELNELQKRAGAGDKAAAKSLESLSEADAELLQNSARLTKEIQKEVRTLARAYIDPQMAGRIWQQFSDVDTSTYKSADGGYVPNISDWTDTEVVAKFTAAVNRDVDMAVITPGLETPLFMSKPVFGMLGQFKRHMASATTRIMMANLQKADASTLAGIITVVSAGMMSAKLYAVVTGKDTSDYRVQDWVREGVNRGGLLGWLEEFNMVTSRFTGGQVDIYRLIGADKIPTRYQSRTALSQLLGPTWGNFENVQQVSRALATGEVAQSDLRAGRELIWGQNLFYIRRLFDQMEEAGADILDVPQQ